MNTKCLEKSGKRSNTRKSLENRSQISVQTLLQPKLSRGRYVSVSYALQNNAVFRRAQNWVSVNGGSRTDNGSEFQSVGPETAKYLWPYLIVLECTAVVFNALQCATVPGSHALSQRFRTS